MDVRRKLALGAVSLAAALGILVTTATPAAASGSICSTNGCAGAADFTSHGEIFTVHDYSPDGHSGVGILEYYVPGEGWYRFEWVTWNSSGYDAPPVKRNWSLAEGTQVRYLACIGERSSGQIWNCSGWKYDRA